jgi:hypothetical protein
MAVLDLCVIAIINGHKRYKTVIKLKVGLGALKEIRRNRTPSDASVTELERAIPAWSRNFTKLKKNILFFRRFVMLVS